MFFSFEENNIKNDFLILTILRTILHAIIFSFQPHFIFQYHFISFTAFLLISTIFIAFIACFITYVYNRIIESAKI